MEAAPSLQRLPANLAALHAEHEVDALVDVELPDGPRDLLDALIEGAGFARARSHRGAQRLRRLHSLPDRLAPNMKMLIVGLNPSPASADSGIGFHKAGNRFWPALIAAELTDVDRDPEHLLQKHGIGMTDIVKRTTRRADEVSRDEFVAGVHRLELVVELMRPERLCFVGLQGWRAVVSPKAERGWQPTELGGAPVYVMPSTSGLNAHDTVDSLAAHFRAAAAPLGRM